VAVSALRDAPGRDGAVLGVSAVLHLLRHVSPLSTLGGGSARVLRARPRSRAAHGRRDPRLLGGSDGNGNVRSTDDRRRSRRRGPATTPGVRRSRSERVGATGRKGPRRSSRPVVGRLDHTVPGGGLGPLGGSRDLTPLRSGQVGVGVGSTVGGGVGVGAGVGVGVGAGVGLGVGSGVGDGVGLGVGDGVGSGPFEMT
jgi:hypothetical protein